MTELQIEKRCYECVPFDRQRASRLKLIEVPPDLITAMFQAAHQSYPREFANAMFGHIHEYAKGGLVARVETLVEVGEPEQKGTRPGFKLTPWHRQRIRVHSFETGQRFIGLVHSHPYVERQEGLPFLLSGVDCFWMYRMQEHVRGVVCVAGEPMWMPATLLFWAYGRHTPLPINRLGDQYMLLSQVEFHELLERNPEASHEARPHEAGVDH